MKLEFKAYFKQGVKRTNIEKTHSLDELTDKYIGLKGTPKKIKSNFRYFNILSLIFSGLFFIAALLKVFNLIDFVDFNKFGLIFMFTITSLTSTFRYYKIKVNLENKIYLLKLLG